MKDIVLKSFFTTLSFSFLSASLAEYKMLFEVLGSSDTTKNYSLSHLNSRDAYALINNRERNIFPGQKHLQVLGDTVHPSNTEVVTPIHKVSFNNQNQCAERRQGGNSRMINGYQVFDGSMDGDRQVDPQIAVGGGYMLEGSNRGLLFTIKKEILYKAFLKSVLIVEYDPKMFFDIHNKVFVFDMWWYYDSAKTKPVNISVSETSNPTGAWNIYPVSRTEEVDGGGIGYSKKWIGYSYPGGDENTFVMHTADVNAGKPATIYHFKGSLGNPIFMQDDLDDLYSWM